jgi:hypothetical protein
VNRFTIATQPTLGAGDAGYLGFEADTGHFVRWTGAAWEFAPGDVGNGFFRPFAITPQETGWVACNATVSSYLKVGGATLTLQAFTTPNLAATPAYLKHAAAYTGTVNAAAGASGSTAITGSTASESSHTHSGTTDTTPNAVEGSRTTLDGIFGFGTTQHSHTFTTGAGSAHSHAVGSLAVDAHTHAIGSLDVAHLDVLFYFRR